MRNKSLFKNIIYNNLYEILLIITPLITTPYVSRVLSPNGIGIYSYTISLVTYFTLLAGLGTANYGMREIARKRDDRNAMSKTFWEIEIMTIISSVICILVWVVFSIFYKEYKIYLLLLSLCIFGSLFDVKWLYAGVEKFKYTILINSISKLLTIICTFLFVRTEEDVWVYILIYSSSIFLGNISMWFFLPKVINKVQPDLKNIKYHLKETLIYFIPSIATTIYTVLDKSLIGIITKDNRQNGYYEQATKIINIMKTISFAAFNGVVTSRVSYLYKENNKEKINKIVEFTFDINLFLTFGCIFGLVGVASNFVPIFFGPGYESTETLLYIFCPLIFMLCISNTLGGLYYNPSGQRGKSAVFLIIGSIINLILNLFLIPFFSIYGAALSSLIAESIISLLYLLKCKKTYTIKRIIKHSYKKVVAGVIMFAFVKMLNLININVYFLLILQIIFGVLIYVVILLVMKDSFYKSFKDFTKE